MVGQHLPVTHVGWNRCELGSRVPRLRKARGPDPALIVQRWGGINAVRRGYGGVACD
jgi:hypothetical protein